MGRKCRDHEGCCDDQQPSWHVTRPTWSAFKPADLFVEKQVAPAAAWYIFNLFGKKWLGEPLFSKKMSDSALPEVKFSAGSMTA
jgi:hypothetical protein